MKNICNKMEVVAIGKAIASQIVQMKRYKCCHVILPSDAGVE